VGGACRSSQASVVLVLSSAPARLGGLAGVEGGPKGALDGRSGAEGARSAGEREREIEMLPHRRDDIFIAL
jgi:hypothetical protein